MRKRRAGGKPNTLEPGAACWSNVIEKPITMRSREGGRRNVIGKPITMHS
ncbi:hypothetical protein MKY96_12335 [Paenibacillus sp. FSL R7-0302]